MTLIGLPFLFVLIAVAGTLVAATMLLWNQWPRWWAVPMRLLCLLLVMASGVALAAGIAIADDSSDARHGVCSRPLPQGSEPVKLRPADFVARAS